MAAATVRRPRLRSGRPCGLQPCRPASVLLKTNLFLPTVICMQIGETKADPFSNEPQEAVYENNSPLSHMFTGNDSNDLRPESKHCSTVVSTAKFRLDGSIRSF